MTTVFPCLVNSKPTPIITSNSEQINRNENQNVNMVHLSLDVCTNVLTYESDDLSNRSAKIDVVQRNSIHSSQ